MVIKRFPLRFQNWRWKQQDKNNYDIVAKNRLQSTTGKKTLPTPPKLQIHQKTLWPEKKARASPQISKKRGLHSHTFKSRQNYELRQADTRNIPLLFCASPCTISDLTKAQSDSYISSYKYIPESGLRDWLPLRKTKPFWAPLHLG